MRSSGGSYAAAQVHNEIRHDKRNADIRMVTKTLQKLVDTLAALNRLNGNFEFILSDDTGLELERAQRDAALVPVLAATGIALTRSYFIDKFDLDENDLTTSDQMTPATGGPTEPGTDDLAQPTEPQPPGPPMEVKTPDQKFAALPTETKPASLQSPLSLREVQSAIRQATGPTDLEHRLGLLLGTGGEQFRRKAGRSTFAAQVLGYVDAHGEDGHGT
jgi:phage gp29-like protein